MFTSPFGEMEATVETIYNADSQAIISHPELAQPQNPSSLGALRDHLPTAYESTFTILSTSLRGSQMCTLSH